MWLQSRANFAGRYIEMRMRRGHLTMRTEGITAFSNRCGVVVWTGENGKCGRKSFWKRSKTAPFSFENGLVWTGPETFHDVRNANRRCTGHATMSTEHGNYRLITVHAPSLLSRQAKNPLAIVVWKPWVTDQRWKIQGDVLHGILPKNTVPTRVTLRVYSPLKVPLRPLSQTFLQIPKQYFVFVSSPKK